MMPISPPISPAKSESVVRSSIEVLLRTLNGCSSKKFVNHLKKLKLRRALRIDPRHENASYRWCRLPLTVEKPGNGEATRATAQAEARSQAPRSIGSVDQTVVGQPKRATHFSKGSQKARRRSQPMNPRTVPGRHCGTIGLTPNEMSDVRTRSMFEPEGNWRAELAHRTRLPTTDNCA